MALFFSSMVKAGEELHDVMGEMTDVMQDVATTTDAMISRLSWQTKLMLYWSSLSPMYKILIVGVLLALIVFIVSKIFGCRKNCH